MFTGTAAMADGKFRLVTRSDFDGLVCGMLLRERGLIDEIKFVHPKDMQDGLVAITGRDIITNLPYVPGCHIAFDHHSSEVGRIGAVPANHVIDASAPSASRVVYRHFGGAAAFPGISDGLMRAVDKADSAQFGRDEILDPSGWTLMNFLMDSRTGLGRFHNFRISNYELMMQLVEKCRHLSVEEVMALPDVRERIDVYMAHREPFEAQLQRCASVYGKLVMLDLRGEETIFAGNRFVIYALFPECDISVHVLWGLKQQNTVFAIGKSILDRASPVDVGALCAAYGGGGHEAAGTCQIANADAERVRLELIAALDRDPTRKAA
jgi:nanoRNase/pAp phosphatase (c-di-AMP/oligoRNAs hydrolase)